MRFSTRNFYIIGLIFMHMSSFAIWPNVEENHPENDKEIEADKSVWPDFEDTHEQHEDSVRDYTKEKELLLLTEIDDLNYNTRSAKLPDFKDLIEIGGFKIIPGTYDSQVFMAGQKRLNLQVRSVNMVNFEVRISKSESLDEACLHIIQRLSDLVASASLVNIISNLAQPKLKGNQYTLLVDSSPYIGLTHLYIERGVIIGVDYRQAAQQRTNSTLNSDEVLAQMATLIEAIMEQMNAKDQIDH